MLWLWKVVQSSKINIKGKLEGVIYENCERLMEVQNLKMYSSVVIRRLEREREADNYWRINWWFLTILNTYFVLVAKTQAVPGLSWQCLFRLNTAHWNGNDMAKISHINKHSILVTEQVTTSLPVIQHCHDGIVSTVKVDVTVSLICGKKRRLYRLVRKTC